MSRHTFPLASRRRLVICPDKFSPGSIRVEIQSADKQVMGSVTLDGPTLALVCQAMELEALAALARDARFEAQCAAFLEPVAKPCGLARGVVCEGRDDCWCEDAKHQPSVQQRVAAQQRDVDRRCEKARIEDAMLARSMAAAGVAA